MTGNIRLDRRNRRLASVLRRASCLLPLVAALGAAPAAGQASLYGIILSSATGTPVEGASVMLRVGEEMAYAATTDRNGFYQLGGIRPAAYTLEVRQIGYAPHLRPLELAAGQRLSLNLQLDPSAVQLEGVVVAAQRGAAMRDLGRQQIRTGELRLAPVPAGSGDLAGYLQTLPGVATTGDRAGQLFVRGGSSAENLVLVDGIPIYQPFHILGFFSVFPETLVSGADFYAGGFGARQHGRTSSVLDVALRDGDASRFRGSGSISPFVGEIVIEGPAGAGASWLLSARRSLIEQTSEALSGERQPISFESQLLKLTATDSEDLRCSVLALRTADRGRLDPSEATSHVSWGNLLAGGRCVTSFENFLRLVEASFSFSSLENAAVSRATSNFRSRIWRMQHDAHATSMIGVVSLYSGYQFYTELTEYDLREIYGMDLEDGDVYGISAYLEAALPVGDLELRPGVVLMAEPRSSLEPRLRAAWRPFGRASEVLHGALGLYRQDVAGISDLRDVGSAFTGWVETPEGAPIEAMHGLLGWQQSIGQGLSWSVEGYYKQLRNLPVPVWQAVAQFTTRVGSADGVSRGADVRVEYASPTLHLLLGYGYGWTEYRAAQKEFATWFGDTVQRYHPPHDRRHQLNLVGTGQVGGFELSARWQLGSGLPFTRPLGFEESFDFSELPHDVSQSRGTTRLILERPFNARLPVMHRLDVAVGREFTFSRARIALRAGAVNAYDRRNVFYYDLFSGRRVDQLPLSPYLAGSARLP